MIPEHYRHLYENQDTLWWYKGMQRISTALLDRYLPKNRDLKILDAGCGSGAALVYLSKYGETMGVDLSEDALKFAKKRGHAIKGSVTDLPFAAGSFDLVFCFGVLYHLWVKDDTKAISEFYRVLKKGGILLLEEPAYNWFMGNEDMISYSRKRYTASDFRRIMKTQPFEILKLTYINSILFPAGLLKRLPEFTGIKKREPKSDIFQIPHIINNIFYNILCLEATLLKYINFPFGMSVLTIAKKN